MKLVVGLSDARYWILPGLALAALAAAFAYHLPGNGPQMGYYLVPCVSALIVGLAFPAVKGGWRWVAIAAAAILVVMSGLLLVWATDHGDIDVTGQVHQSSDQPLADDKPRTLTVDIPRPRSSLAISFRLAEHYPDQMCVPHTWIQVNTKDGYGIGPLAEGQVRVQDYEAATIMLDRSRTKVELNLTVVTDKDCEVDLYVDKAILKDR